MPCNPLLDQFQNFLLPPLQGGLAQQLLRKIHVNLRSQFLLKPSPLNQPPQKLYLMRWESERDRSGYCDKRLDHRSPHRWSYSAVCIGLGHHLYGLNRW